MRGRRFCPLIVSLIVSLIGGASLAVAASPAVDAEMAIKRGVELRRRGADAQALDEFKSAYDTTKSPRALGQMALAEQALGRWADAEEHLSGALSNAGDAWVKKNQGTLEKSLTMVGAHLGNLEILGSPEGAEVGIEGRVIGRLPLAKPLRVAAGTVGVEVRADGYLATSRSVSIIAGELTRETVVLQKTGATRMSSPSLPPESTPRPIAAAATPRSSPTNEPPRLISTPTNDAGRWRRPAAWATASGAILFTGGAFVALLARSHYADVLSSHVQSSSCMAVGDQFSGPEGPACADAANSREKAQALGIASGALAGAFAVTSAVLFMTSARTDEKTVACLPGTTSQLVSCRLTF